MPEERIGVNLAAHHARIDDYPQLLIDHHGSCSEVGRPEWREHAAKRLLRVSWDRPEPWTQSGIDDVGAGLQELAVAADLHADGVRRVEGRPTQSFELRPARHDAVSGRMHPTAHVGGQVARGKREAVVSARAIDVELQLRDLPVDDLDPPPQDRQVAGLADLHQEKCLPPDGIDGQEIGLAGARDRPPQGHHAQSRWMRVLRRVINGSERQRVRIVPDHRFHDLDHNVCHAGSIAS